MTRHYRPTENVQRRPTKLGGQGFYLVGHHEIMIPLLFAAVKEELARSLANDVIQQNFLRGTSALPLRTSMFDVGRWMLDVFPRHHESLPRQRTLPHFSPSASSCIGDSILDEFIWAKSPGSRPSARCRSSKCRHNSWYQAAQANVGPQSAENSRPIFG
jgi:hypothetical protein